MRSLVLIKLQILLFNLNFSTIVYFTKMIALAASIIGGFGALKLLDRNVPFACVYGVMFMEGNVLYSIMFNRSFRIPEKMDEIKREMLAGCSRWRSSNSNSDLILKRKKEEVRAVVRSMPELGVEAGSFNLMERESTLLFTDFSVQQIVGLRIAF
jgi:hypothetical protein